MTSSVRRQILLPLLIPMLGVVSVIAVTSAWVAVAQAERQTLRQLASVVETLAGSAVTYTEPVLLKMRGLSGAEFIAMSSAGRVESATVPVEPALLRNVAALPRQTRGFEFSRRAVLTLPDGRRFLVAVVAADGAARVSSLAVLYPEASWRETQWAAIWPPLLVGVATTLLMSVASSWVAGRITRRVRTVQALLGRIAHGGAESESGSRGELGPRASQGDEVDDLTHSALRLETQLAELEARQRQSERMRLMAQIAGGVAHQLRNAVTGARLALQLHQRRCPLGASDESLSVALRQLTLTEEQVRGLLALSRREERPAVPGRIADILQDVQQLVRPQFEHSGVRFSTPSCDEERTGGSAVADAEALRTGLLNLVLNAHDAAGPGGSVTVEWQDSAGVWIEVRDSGPGPAEAVRESLFDPFVTTRPEGVGLGLPLAKQAVESLGGTLSWLRRDDLTVFRIELPDASFGVR